MAPNYRIAAQTRRGARAAAEHDTFEGLPVRQWRQEWQTIDPPSILHSERKVENRWAKELPHGMPKDWHLLTPHAQDLLRAARTGVLYKRRAPVEDEEPDTEVRGAGPSTVVAAPKDAVVAGPSASAGPSAGPGGDKKRSTGTMPVFVSRESLVVKVWKQQPRDADAAMPSYLAIRPKGTIVLPPKALAAYGMEGYRKSGFIMPMATVVRVRRYDADGKPYEQSFTIADNQIIEGEIVAKTLMPATSADLPPPAVSAPPVRKRNPPPRRKARVGRGRGRKKGVMPIGLQRKRDAMAAAAAAAAEAAAAEAAAAQAAAAEAAAAQAAAAEAAAAARAEAAAAAAAPAVAATPLATPTPVASVLNANVETKDQVMADVRAAETAPAAPSPEQAQAPPGLPTVEPPAPVPEAAPVTEAVDQLMPDRPEEPVAAPQTIADLMNPVAPAGDAMNPAAPAADANPAAPAGDPWHDTFGPVVGTEEFDPNSWHETLGFVGTAEEYDAAFPESTDANDAIDSIFANTEGYEPSTAAQPTAAPERVASPEPLETLRSYLAATGEYESSLAAQSRDTFHTTGGATEGHAPYNAFGPAK